MKVVHKSHFPLDFNPDVSHHISAGHPTVSARGQIKVKLELYQIPVKLSNKKAAKMTTWCALYKWIKWAVAEIWPFEIIRDGSRPPTWIWCNRKRSVSRSASRTSFTDNSESARNVTGLELLLISCSTGCWLAALQIVYWWAHQTARPTTQVQIPL